MVLVAVSGGPDSVAMLDLLVRLFRRGGPLIHVAHMDHMLRGSESVADAEFVRALAARLTLPSTIGSADVAGTARLARRGVEETARELRHRFLLDAALAAGAARIAIGHTVDDQAETILLRLTRGAGTSGLAAMRAVTPAHSFESTGSIAPDARERVCIVRPLLCLTRCEVEDYCRERRLDYRVDPSNVDVRYARNKLRRVVMPVLRELNPRVAKAFARAAEIVASDCEALDEITVAALKECDTGRGLSVACLLRQPAAVRRRLLIEAVRRRPGSSQLGSTHVEALERLLYEGAGGRRVELPGGLAAWREFDTVVLARTVPCAQPYEVRISRTQPRIVAGDFVIEVTRDVPAGRFTSLLERIKDRAEPTYGLRNWSTVLLDGSSLPARLLVRPRRPGERALVLGQTGAKKLKNLMIDHRIPTSRRATWPVVVTLDGSYVWSPGLPPAAQFAARADSSGLVVLRASGRSTEEQYATNDTRDKVRARDQEPSNHAGGGDSFEHPLR